MDRRSSGSDGGSPDRERFTDIRVVSFDLDDTFWDCEPAIRYAEHVSYEWLARHTPRITRRYDEAALAERRQQIYRSRPELLGDVTAQRKASFAQLFEEFGYPSALVEEAFAEFYRARSEVTLYPGVVRLLERLKRRYWVAAITNGNADLERIGIGHHFHSVKHASLSLAAKPATAMFDACLAEFDQPPAALLHVGDNPDTDVGGAHNAGAHACWYNPGNQAWPEDRKPPRLAVCKLAELEHLLV